MTPPLVVMYAVSALGFIELLILARRKRLDLSLRLAIVEFAASAAGMAMVFLLLEDSDFDQRKPVAIALWTIQVIGACRAFVEYDTTVRLTRWQVSYILGSSVLLVFGTSLLTFG